MLFNNAWPFIISVMDVPCVNKHTDVVESFYELLYVML